MNHTPTVVRRALIAAPDRSLTQRMDALDRANEVRVRRAQLKRDLKAGRVSFSDMLLDAPEWLTTAKAYDMLLAVPKVGRVKANKAFNRCRISPSKTVGGLSQRQRVELLAWLRQPARNRAPSAFTVLEERHRAA